MSRKPPAVELREIQGELSGAFVRLERLYRYHQSRRMAAIPAIQELISAANTRISDLAGALQNVPAPTPQEIEERGYL